MPRRTIVKEFAFIDGEHAEADAKLLPDGYLTRAKNVRLRKDGRFGVRADFDAVGNDTSYAGDWVPYDLMPHGDALCSVGGSGSYASDDAPWDLANLAATAPVDWKFTDVFTGQYAPIGRVSNVRQIAGFVNSPTFLALGVSRADCAAAGGYVAFVVHSGSGSSSVRIFRAATGAVVLDSSVSTRARVVAVGTVFFFVSIAVGSDDLELYKFDPASDVDVVGLTPIVTSFAFSSFDVSVNHAGNGLWVALNTTAPTTKIYPVNSAGVTGSAINGPNTLYSFVTVRETSSRVHLVSVTSGGTCQLRSYTTGGSLSTGPTTVTTTCQRQPGTTDATFQGTEQVGIFAEQATSPSSVKRAFYDASTHSSSSLTWDDAFLAAKPIVTGAINLHHLFAGVQADGSFFSLFLAGGDLADFNDVYAYENKFATSKPQADHTPQIARDASTGKFYLPSFVIDVSGNPMPVLTEFDFASTARRQSTEIAGLLYLGGGAVQAYDGRTLVEAGFFERPRILSAAPSNGAGSLPSSTTLLVAVVWEYRDALNNLYSSDVSEVTTVTMGASDDTITLSVSGPHGLKQYYGSVTLAAYRSIDGIDQLRRAETLDSCAPGANALTLLLSDTVVRANGIIYTQAARGVLSGTLPHEAPLPADYVWKFGSRILSANADGAQVSKEIFPSEPVNWSGAVGFTIPKISERITGVAALDQRGLLFTAERIYQFSGDGPNDNGEGRYSEPLPVPGSTGLMTWQSLVETPIGLFFQGSNGQLWVLPRDGSPPLWIGQPVRDTLVAFPTVTSATLVTAEQLVSFTCNNLLGTDCRIVHYDLRAKTWIVDEFASATPIAAAASYRGRLAMLSAGVVYTEKTTLTPNAFLAHGLTTGRVDLDGAGWRKFATVGFVGEYRGDSNLQFRISYDDGKTFPDSKTFALLASGGLTVGDTVEREWSPLRRKAEHIVLDFEALTAGSATEGLAFNKWWIAFIPERGTSRSPAAQRG